MHERIKNDILGKKYSLSVAFVSPKKSRVINKKYRKVDKPTNVLAFPFDKSTGEILLCKNVIKREARLRLKASDGQAKNFKKVYSEWEKFMVIHGMLHLKGMKHGSIMERAEKFYCKKYYDQKYFYRHRRGLRYDQSGSGRIRQGRKNS